MSTNIKETVLDRYELKDAGIPYRITLENAVIAEIDSASGEVLSTEIPAFDNLMASIAVRRCHRPEKLNGDDLCFLRRVLGFSARDFAAEINTAPETLCRWEKQKQTIGEQQERLIRIYVVEILKDIAPAIPIDRICIIQIGLKTAPENAQALHFDFRLQKIRDRHNHTLEDAWDELPTAA